MVLTAQYIKWFIESVTLYNISKKASAWLKSIACGNNNNNNNLEKFALVETCLPLTMLWSAGVRS